MIHKIQKEKKLSNNSVAKRKLRKKTIIRSILLIAFLFAINTFAWFTYISRAGVTLNASVVNWDVTFLEETNIIKEIDIDINDMHPGMIPFEKEIVINNAGDIDAKIDYKIESLTLLGKELVQENPEPILDYMKKEYPFKLELITSSDIIPVDDQVNVKISLNWEFEEDEFYKLNQLYTYDPTVNYYIIVGDNYQIDNTVTQTNFQEKLNSGLYLEKDDTDSYWGYTCGKYEQETGKACLHMKLELNVSQMN